MTAIAQSVAAKRERQSSISDASISLEQLTITPKADKESEKVTKDEEALSKAKEGSVAATETHFVDTKENRTAVETN